MTGRQVDEQALKWAIRAADPHFEDWDGLTGWLEADPGNHDRYDDALTAMAEARDRVAAMPLRAEPVAANDERPVRHGFWRWGGSAVATMLVAVVGVSVWNERSQPYAVETAPGEQRAVQLADGSEIVLAGGSRVTLDRADPRVASVEHGEMLFRVRHDAAHPFRVTTGDTQMVDLGTVFDVTHDAGGTRIAVAEGAVMVAPDSAKLRLEPGQAVVARGGELRRQVATDVGGWREGRLTFDNAPLSDVARDLTRQLGRTVRVDPALAARPFSGTIDIRSLRDDPARLGRLLGVSVRADGKEWVLGDNR